MLIIPAIDLMDGCVVRLVQGKKEKKKIYSRNPVRTARHWVKLGASALHVEMISQILVKHVTMI